MKIQKLYLPLLILAFIFSGSFVQAQSKSEKEQQEKIEELEKKLEQALKMREAELEKVLKQSKIMQEEELKKMLENQKEVQQKAVEQYKKSFEYLPDQYKIQRDFYRDRGDTRFRIVEPDLDMDFDVEPFENFRGIYTIPRTERTALTIRKDLADVTFDTKFKYDVTEGARGLSFSVEGSVDDGLLIVRLTKPDNSVMQEIEISPLADVSWNQNLRWDEEENKSNLGTWVIVVSAKNATGHYSVNIRAN